MSRGMKWPSLRRHQQWEQEHQTPPETSVPSAPRGQSGLITALRVHRIKASECHKLVSANLLRAPLSEAERVLCANSHPRLRPESPGWRAGAGDLNGQTQNHRQKPTAGFIHECGEFIRLTSEFKYFWKVFKTFYSQLMLIQRLKFTFPLKFKGTKCD